MKKTWLLKVLEICLCVYAGLFLFTPYLQAATPTYIELEFSDIDYDEAQYIKFIIDADEDFDIFLYMKDNDNNNFYVIYQTENNELTGDFDKDDNDELIIYLDEDNYVTGHDETFDSFDHSNGIMSFDKYINTQWKKHEYDGGSAELEKIRIFGNKFKLYYIAIDDGDFSDPIWEIDVSDEKWDSTGDFKDDGHRYSTTTDIAFSSDYIYITRDIIAAAGVGYEGLQYPGGFYGGYPGYGYPPWTYYGGNTGYLPPGGIYGPGYQQPYNPYGYQHPYQQPYNPYGYQQFNNPYGLANDFGGYPPAGNQPSYNPNNPYVYPWANQPPYGYRPHLTPYGYYQMPTLANDMFGNGYPTFSNPYGVGYQQPSYYPY